MQETAGDPGVQGEEGRPDEIPVQCGNRTIVIRTWSLSATLAHVKCLIQVFQRLNTLELLRDDLEPAELLRKLDPADWLSDDYVQHLYAMIRDATLDDNGTPELSLEQIAALNQFHAWALIAAVWRINVRPHLARLRSQGTRSGPLTMPAQLSADSVLPGSSPAIASPSPQ